VNGLDEAIARAREAAGGKDVGIGGGADVIRQAVRAGHVEELSISIAPVILGGGKRLFEGTEAKVDSKNPERGPMLIISGESDHTVPWAIANASYKREKRNDGVTEIVKIPNRGHALTIDSGWREVADTALGFLKRFV